MGVDIGGDSRDIGPSLDEKVFFLSRPEAYAARPESVARRETHMSWVFFAGERVFKLKKPVRFPYLDFSTLARREAACRAELRLNRRLAPAVYLDVQPLTINERGLEIGGCGAVVDWLVVMRRLDDARMLDRGVVDGWIAETEVDELSRTLARFYRGAHRIARRPAAHLSQWRRHIAINRRVLTLSDSGIPHGFVRRIDRAQRRFLALRQGVLADRVRTGALVDGHGDLRPEHIWMGSPIQIIDCLEFNAALRTVDPWDEIAYLSVECERLGAPWIGHRLRRRLARALHDSPSDELFAFYRCHRATLRARLAIAHLHEASPRTPDKWLALARAYLAIAAQDARPLERALRKRPNR